MKGTIARISAAVVLLCVAAFAQAAPAPSKIGLISLEGSVFGSNEGQRDVQALQKKIEPRANELSALQAEIEGLQKQLQTQQGKLSPEAAASLEKQITTKTTTFNRNKEDLSNDYQSALAEVFQRIAPKVNEVLKDYSDKNGYSLVLNVDTLGASQQVPAVLYAAKDGVDLTETVVKLYNEKSGVAAPEQPKAPAAKRPVAPAAK